VTPDVLAPADDAVGKRDTRRAAHELAHLEVRSTLATHIESAAIALRREEYLIVAALDHLGEVFIELHDHAAAFELRRTEVLEPNLRAFHAIEGTVRAIGERHRTALCR